MRSKNKHFSNLHMLRSTCCIECNISYIVAGKGLNSFIYIVGLLLIAMESDNTEIGFNQPGLTFVTRNSCVCDINTQSVRKSFH